MVWIAMRNNRLILPLVLVLAGCASPVMLSAASPDGSTHRLLCRAKLDCPQMAAQLCAGDYEIVDGDGVIGSLSDVMVACR